MLLPVPHTEDYVGRFTLFSKCRAIGTWAQLREGSAGQVGDGS